MTIKEARKKAGLTQDGMSKLMDIPKRTIQAWESGERIPPDYVKELVIQKIKEIEKGNRKMIKISKEDLGIVLDYVLKKGIENIAYCINENGEFGERRLFPELESIFPNSIPKEFYLKKFNGNLQIDNKASLDIQSWMPRKEKLLEYVYICYLNHDKNAQELHEILDREFHGKNR